MELINNYGNVLWYVSLAMLIGIIAIAWWRGRSGKKPGVPGPAV